MKLTKKLLVGLVVLALMAGMALTAFAADPKLAINVGEANDKGEVKVNVILKNAAGLMDGAFYLKFDGDAYSYVKMSPGIDTKNSGATIVGDLITGTTSVSGAFAIPTKVEASDDEDEPVNADNFVLMVVTLKVKDAAKAKKAAFEAGTIENEPITVNDAKVNVAKVTLAPKEEETTTAAPATTTTAPATTKPTTIPKTGLSSGDALASAAIATLAVAAAAFVVTKKKK
ncbi:MAG: LPXTG cell wall anchor domain-containing protein [Acutalibacteraceae bacterium]